MNPPYLIKSFLEINSLRLLMIFGESLSNYSI